MPKRILLCSLLLAAPLAAESLDPSRLQAIADTLLAGYVQKTGAADKASLAVMAFSSSAKSANANPGFAVSEFLTQSFVKQAFFKVVDRDFVRKPRAAPDGGGDFSVGLDSAAEVGSAIGAQYLVLGSVEKVGGFYKVNARLVRAANGEILATAFDDFPSDVFEERSPGRDPKRRKFGFYGAYQVLPKTKAKSSFSSPPSSISFKASPRDFATSFIGGGLRIFPHKNIVVDAGIFFFASKAKAFDVLLDYPSFPQRYQRGYSNKANYARSFVAWTSLIGKKASWEGGIGASYYSMTMGPPWNGGRAGIVSISNKNGTVYPFIRLGVEYRPLSHVGLGLAVNQDIAPVKGEYKAGGTAFVLSGLSLEPTLDFYF